MLLPRFTIRTLLVLCTVCAVVFVMVGAAYRGQYWAWGVTIAILSVIVTLSVHAAWFAVVSFLARMISPQPQPVQVPAPAAQVSSDRDQPTYAADEHFTTQPLSGRQE
jgi:hypothetical protein